MPAPQLVPSLVKLREQVNAAYPQRSKLSDGWIGDPAHKARKSDHNPDGAGWVRALDLTHDPANGFDSWQFAETLRLSRDKRISYVISNGRIFSSTVSPWTWRPYDGSNKHAAHVHVSVTGDSKALATTPWVISSGKLTGAPPIPPLPPKGISDQLRLKMGTVIIGYEVRKDAKGNPEIYTASDGSREIVGINERYHKPEFDKIAALLALDDFKGVEFEAARYIIGYTKIVTGWVTEAGLEFYLRDCCFHRGPTGAAMILQIALGFEGAEVDGEVGPATRQRIAATKAPDLLERLRLAREKYENQKYGARPALRPGLINRWNKALKDAKDFSRQGAAGGAPVKEVVTGTVITGGATSAGAAAYIGLDASTIVAIVVITIAAGLIIWKVWRQRERSSLE